MGTINLPIPWVDYHRGGHPWAFSYMQPDPCPFCGMTRDEQQLADEARQTDFYQDLTPQPVRKEVTMPTQIVPEISRQLSQAYERTQRELASDDQMATQVWDEAITQLQGFDASDATPAQFVEAHAAVSILEQVLTSVSGRTQLFTNGNT